MVFIHNDLCVWEECPCKLCIGPPHVADEEPYIQAFFPGDTAPIIRQMTLGPVWKDIEDAPLFRINQDALISAGGSVPFEFVNGKCLREPVGRRIADGIQEPADRLDGNTGKPSNLFHGKGLAEQGYNVECKPACPAVVAGQERAGFRKTFAAGGTEVTPFTKDQDYVFTL